MAAWEIWIPSTRFWDQQQHVCDSGTFQNKPGCSAVNAHLSAFALSLHKAKFNINNKKIYSNLMMSAKYCLITMLNSLISVSSTCIALRSKTTQVWEAKLLLRFIRPLIWANFPRQTKPLWVAQQAQKKPVWKLVPPQHCQKIPQGRKPPLHPQMLGEKYHSPADYQEASPTSCHARAVNLSYRCRRMTSKLVMPFR